MYKRNIVKLNQMIKSNSNKLKKFSKFALVVIAMVFLVGCTQQNQTPQTSGEITLQWWGVFLDKSVVESLIKEYESQNAGVKIDYANRWPGGRSELAAQSYQDELNRVLRENNSVAIPDIFMIENTWVRHYENFVAAAPGDVTDANTVKTSFYPAVAKDFAKGDVVRGLPLWMDNIAIIYNRNLLAAASLSTPPTDWVNFKQAALDLTQRSGGQITVGGFAAGTGTNTTFGTEIFNLLLAQNGVQIADNNGNPVFSGDSDSLSAYSFFKSFEGAAAGSWDKSFENDALAFLQGKLAMLAAPSWRLNEILFFNEKYNLGLNVGVAPMPQLQGQTIPVLNWATYWGNVVARNRPNSAAAWKFLNWLTQPDQLRKLDSNIKINQKFFGIVYPRTDMQQDLQADQYLRVYNSALPTAETWYQGNGLAVRKEFIKLLDATGSPQNLVPQAENSIQQILNRNGQL